MLKTPEFSSFNRNATSARKTCDFPINETHSQSKIAVAWNSSHKYHGYWS